MGLSQRLNEDMRQAMKSQDKFKLSITRMVRSVIKNVEIDKRKTLHGDEVLEIVSCEIKQRKDTLHEFEKADRGDLSDHVSDRN